MTVIHRRTVNFPEEMIFAIEGIRSPKRPIPSFSKQVVELIQEALDFRTVKAAMKAK